jgi:predicted amidohydrolase
MKVASIQMNAVFADVRANLKKAADLIQEVAKTDTELVLFPEFFPSAIGFSEKMLDVANESSQVHSFLETNAKKYNLIIGGSYLCLKNKSAFNQFELVFPNGNTYLHCKDIPTQFEGCYYTNGDTEHILDTPIGKIGIALCWEMMRYDTIKRIGGQAGLLLCGSCWWDLPEDSPAEREPLRQYNQALALHIPVRFAKLAGIPMVHASHCGKVTAYHFPAGDKTQTRQLVGAAQVIGSDGTVMARRSFAQGEGIVYADIPIKPQNSHVERRYPDEYWIEQLPEAYLDAWDILNPLAKSYYETTTRYYYQNTTDRHYKPLT